MASTQSETGTHARSGGDTPEGLAFAVGAYVLWGFLPLYLKALEHVSPIEVVAHRILWAVPVAGLVLVALRRTDTLREALRSPRMLAMGAVTAGLISINWGIYVWAISAGRALDASLGYYMNPLMSVLLGALLLGERLDRLQVFAIAFAVLAVAVLTWETGSLPLPALGLMLSWGLYALAKKQLPIGPNQGFLLEVLLLSPLALGAILWVSLRGEGHFLAASPSDTWLLLGCGVVTAVPLLLYANGAKRLRLSTVGILQYIAPTMIFVVAVFVFEEPFGRAQAIAFPLIWLAVVLYSVAMLSAMRRKG